MQCYPLFWALSEHPGYCMIGPDLVCSDAAIGKLCQEVKYFNSIDDVNAYHIRPEFVREYLMYLWRQFQLTYRLKFLDVMYRCYSSD